MSTILIRDNDPRATRQLADLLTKAGHEVVCAAHSGEIFGLLEARQFDLVILDKLTPYASGAETLHMLRVSKSFRSLPVVVWSGSADPITMAYARKLGVADYIVKASLQLPEIQSRLEACLRKAA